jgi:hypothetical protein
MAGAWRWPDPEAIPSEGEAGRLAPATLERLIDRLRDSVVGEKVAEGTWRRMYAPFLNRLVTAAGQRRWSEDGELLGAVLRQWEPNSRARQMAHDRFRHLWKEAGWPWPDALLELRGNGKAAASPEGVRSFTDAEIEELRAAVPPAGWAADCHGLIDRWIRS